MTYDEAIDWLFSLHRFGMKLGLENIRILLDGLGRPQDRFDSVLIAGTNGKGSTAAMIHGILVASGIRSGLYTSPHLVRTEERIRIGDADIAPEDLAAVLTEVRSCIDRLRPSGDRAAEAGTGAGPEAGAGRGPAPGPALEAYPTFFEVMTAAGLLAFERAGVEVAVLEVGLGGRLDATNVVSPVLSVISSIDLDHQEQLGPTLASIAREKAGILRRDVPALLGDIEGDALQAIRDEAAATGAPLIIASEGCTLQYKGQRLGGAPAGSSTEGIRDTDAKAGGFPRADSLASQLDAGIESNGSGRTARSGWSRSSQAPPRRSEEILAAIAQHVSRSIRAGDDLVTAPPVPRGSASQERAATNSPTSASSSRRSSAPAPRFVQTFALTTPVRTYPLLSCPLPGAHQRSNVQLAVRTAETLDELRSVPSARTAALPRFPRRASREPDPGPASTRPTQPPREHATRPTEPTKPPREHATEPTAPTQPPTPRVHRSSGPIDARAIVKGIAAVRWPGRLEWVGARPRLLLDGAHNVAGCRVLAEYLVSIPVRPVLLFAAMRDKEVASMLGVLLPRVSTVVFTMPPSSRACDPSELLECARLARARQASKADPRPAGEAAREARPPGANPARPAPRDLKPGADEIAMLRATNPASLEVEPLHHPAEVLPWTESEGWFSEGDVGSALALARSLAGPDGTVLVAGSLFLVGAVKEILAGLPVRAGALS